MKVLLSSLRTGETSLAETPWPRAPRNGLVIATRRTLVSAGTERMLVEFGKAGLLKKARSQPDKRSPRPGQGHGVVDGQPTTPLGGVALHRVEDRQQPGRRHAEESVWSEPMSGRGVFHGGRDIRTHVVGDRALQVEPRHL